MCFIFFVEMICDDFVYCVIGVVNCGVLWCIGDV